MNASITSGQRLQLVRVFEDAIRKVAPEAIDKAILTKELAQYILGHGDQVPDILEMAIGQFICRMSVNSRAEQDGAVGQFTDEEVESSYGYLSGYKPKGITEQTNILRQLIPSVGYTNEKLAEQPLPPNAEGWFAIPRWQKLGSTYEKALQEVLDLIKQARNGRFCNCRKGQIGPDRLRLRSKTQKALEALGQQQEGNDILVIPCQFGLRHRGRSVRRALEIMPIMEFGLDPFTVACMLLTHPERLQHYDDLRIDCAGAEYDFGGGGSFDGAPYFRFDGDGVEFGGGCAGDASDGFGSSSGFLFT